MKRNIPVKLTCIALSLFVFWGCKKKIEGEALPELNIEQYFPSSGKGGTLVRIQGSGFSTDYNTTSVQFSGVKGEVISLTEEEVVVQAPLRGKTGPVKLKNAGRDIEVGTYTYQALSVQALSPAKSQGGSQISIKGEGFSSVEAPPKVFFSQEEATVLSASDTVLVVEVPKEGSGVGPVRVQVDDMEATGPNFIFMGIEQMRPMSGGQGTRVRIEGEGFEELQANNEVTFNGKKALVETASPTALVVIAPEGVESGPVNISIEGETISGPDFTVVPLPEIHSVSPLSGPAGLEMRITGSYFSTQEGETKVFINGQELALSSVSNTEIRLTLPGETGTGPVLVWVNDQQTEGPEFKDQTLGILGMTPDNALAGYEVTIKGAGFSTVPQENQVRFNGVQAQVISATENSLVVRTPEGLTTGTLEVQVGAEYAEAPTTFRRAGVLSYGAGNLQISSGGSLAVDDQGNMYVLEIDQHRIMKITPQGQVSHFAGSSSGQSGDRDGMGNAALFSLSPNAGLSFDSRQQRLYLSDAGNQKLKTISLAGEVETLIASLPGAPGKMAALPGKLLITNASSAYSMWEVSLPSGQLSSISVTHSLPQVRPGWDPAGSIYSMHIGVFNASIGRSAPSGSGWSKTLSWAGKFAKGFVDGVGPAAQFGVITGYAMGDDQHLLILDPDNYALRKADIQTAEITTAVKGSAGFADGLLTEAKFSDQMADIYVASDGTAYILDCGNQAVRKVMFR